MEQPKLAITRMAKRLRRKVVDVEEYLENNQAPLDPTQQRHLENMHKDMRDQLGRIKQAWSDHDEEYFDDAYVSEIASIITESEYDVREALEESRKFMSVQRGTSDVTQTTGGINKPGEHRESKEQTGGRADEKEVITEDGIPHRKEIQIRKVDVENGPQCINRSVEPASAAVKGKENLETVRATVKLLMAAQDGPNYGRQKLTKEKRKKREGPGAHERMHHSAREENAGGVRKKRIWITRGAEDNDEGEPRDGGDPTESDADEAAGEKIVNPEMKTLNTKKS